MKYKYLFMMLLVASTSFAQMVVNDPTANAQLAAIKVQNTKTFLKTSGILVKAKATLTTLSNMKNTYDEWTEAVRVVNSVIEHGQEIINISNHISDIGNTYDKAVTLISNEDELSNKQKEIYILVFTKIVLNAANEFSEANQLVTNGTFEMNDSERLNLLREIEKKIARCNSLSRYAYRKMARAIRKAKGSLRDNQILLESLEAVKG